MERLKFAVMLRSRLLACLLTVFHPNRERERECREDDSVSLLEEEAVQQRQRGNNDPTKLEKKTDQRVKLIVG